MLLFAIFVVIIMRHPFPPLPPAITLTDYGSLPSITHTNAFLPSSCGRTQLADINSIWNNSLPSPCFPFTGDQPRVASLGFLLLNGKTDLWLSCGGTFDIALDESMSE